MEEGGCISLGNNTYTTSGGAQNTISGAGGGNLGINLNGYIATFNVAVGSDPDVANLNITGKLWNIGGIIKTARHDGAIRIEHLQRPDDHQRRHAPDRRRQRRGNARFNQRHHQQWLAGFQRRRRQPHARRGHQRLRLADAKQRGRHADSLWREQLLRRDHGQRGHLGVA